MKILIGSLLFATAILINFSELNASPPPTGADSSLSNVHVRSYQLRAKRPPIYITHIEVLSKNIEVYLTKNDNDEYVVFNCNVCNFPSKIPTTSDKGKCNFMVQPFFKDYNGSRIKIVIYVKINKLNKKTLLGAKVPPKEHEVFAPGDPLGLDPDESKYFFTHNSMDYVVEYDARSDTATDVKLWGHSNIRPDYEEIKMNWHTYHYFRFNEIYILLFLNKHDELEGVAIDPFWTYRPNEKDAHLNPFVEYQETHGINIEKYYPLAANTAPHESVHQNPIIAPQHDAHHQLNLNPYEHPHTNQILDQYHNQHYAHQSDYLPVPFDSSHHRAQKSVYPPSYFDSSQYHGQSSGTSPEHFDPNANLNHPPHYPPNP